MRALYSAKLKYWAENMYTHLHIIYTYIHLFERMRKKKKYLEFRKDKIKLSNCYNFFVFNVYNIKRKKTKTKKTLRFVLKS